MGTGKPGRNLNTKGGSGRKVSDFALVHSIEGLFTQPMRRRDRLRLKSGGHGHKGMLLLDKYGIEYNVVKTYPNGVRVGNVPDHVNRRKRTGTGQSWFPKSWSPNDIRRAGEHVAGLKKNRHAPDGKISYGMYKGVRVCVIRTHGEIATVFPDSNQPVKRKKKKMNIKELIATIIERIRIGDETQDEWDYGLEQCWQKEINLLSIGEVFEDVAELTQSKEFVCAIKKRAEKIVDTEQRRSVKVDIRFAEDRLV